MKENNDILQELSDMNSPLAGISRSMPYVLPDDYFDSLPANIMAGIRLDAISKAMPYVVPEKYFVSFEAELAKRINETEEGSLPKTIMPFTAPAGYFDTLPQQILSKVKASQKPGAKTIAIGTEIWRQIRWAAAAILLLGIGIGSFKIFVKPQPLSPETALSQVSKSEVSLFVEQNIDDFDADMLAGNMSAGDIQALTKQLNDEDIQQYLDDTGWEKTE